MASALSLLHAYIRRGGCDNEACDVQKWMWKMSHIAGPRGVHVGVAERDVQIWSRPSITAPSRAIIPIIRECQTPKWSKDCTARLFINSSLSGVCHTPRSHMHARGARGTTLRARRIASLLLLALCIKARGAFPRRRAGVEIVIWTKFTFVISTALAE
jgi:hypothetical protein